MNEGFFVDSIEKQPIEIIILFMNFSIDVNELGKFLIISMLSLFYDKVDKSFSSINYAV
jgi:hypothetical protein